MAADFFSHGFSQSSAAAFNDDVDVLARAAKKAVSDITSYNKGPYTHLCSSFRDYLKYFVIKKSVVDYL